MPAPAEPGAAPASLAALLAILLLSGGLCAEAAEQDATGITINATLSAAELQQVMAEVRRVDPASILAIIDASKAGRVGIDTEGTHLVVMMGNPEPAAGEEEAQEAPAAPQSTGAGEAPETPGVPDVQPPTIHLLERQGERWIVIKTTKVDC